MLTVYFDYPIRKCYVHQMQVMYTNVAMVTCNLYIDHVANF